MELNIGPANLVFLTLILESLKLGKDDLGEGYIFLSDMRRWTTDLENEKKKKINKEKKLREAKEGTREK